jgi:hypothetical protein
VLESGEISPTTTFNTRYLALIHGPGHRNPRVPTPLFRQIYLAIHTPFLPLFIWVFLCRLPYRPIRILSFTGYQVNGKGVGTAFLQAAYVWRIMGPVPIRLASGPHPPLSLQDRLFLLSKPHMTSGHPNSTREPEYKRRAWQRVLRNEIRESGGSQC